MHVVTEQRREWERVLVCLTISGIVVATWLQIIRILRI